MSTTATVVVFVLVGLPPTIKTIKRYERDVPFRCGRVIEPTETTARSD